MVNLPNVELDAMLAMNLFSSTINNMVTIYERLILCLIYTVYIYIIVIVILCLNRK